MKTGTEIITHTISSIQTWRQVGWLGQSNKFYSLDDKPELTEKGGFSPIYILAHNEPPVLDWKTEE